MSQYITGAGSSCWGCLETTYGAGFPDGTQTADTSLVNMTSESISTTYNRLEEGTLLASKTRPAQDLASVAVSGGISTVFKPDFADFVFKWAMGKKSDTTATDYAWYTGYSVSEYTLADPDEDLPSAVLLLNRSLPKKNDHPQNFLYDGLTISSVAFDCTAQDFVKADININGHKETLKDDADYGTGYPAPPANSSMGSYKCTSARLIKKVAGTQNLQAWFDDGYFPWDACPSDVLHKVWDVSRAQFTIDNGLEDAPATYCSGLYANQPSHGQRSVTLSCEVPYSESFEEFRQTYYASENPENLALLLAFCTKETHEETHGGKVYDVPDHQVFILIPNVNIDGADANVGGQGLINSNFNGTALSIGNVEPLKVIKADYNAN